MPHGNSVWLADAHALALLAQHLSHIAQVSDTEVAQALREICTCTHNVTEGAGGCAGRRTA